MNNKIIALFSLAFLLVAGFSAQDAHAFKFQNKAGVYAEVYEDDCYSEKEYGFHFGFSASGHPDKKCRGRNCGAPAPMPVAMPAPMPMAYPMPVGYAPYPGMYY